MRELAARGDTGQVHARRVVQGHSMRSRMCGRCSASHWQRQACQAYCARFPWIVQIHAGNRALHGMHARAHRCVLTYTCAHSHTRAQTRKHTHTTRATTRTHLIRADMEPSTTMKFLVPFVFTPAGQCSHCAVGALWAARVQANKQAVGQSCTLSQRHGMRAHMHGTPALRPPVCAAA